jgi:hypothetical protein
MPADALALAVFVGGQDQLVGLFERGLQLGDQLAFLVRDHVERVKVIFDVDAQPRPRHALVLLRDFGGRGGQVAHVPHARLDLIFPGQKLADSFGFGWRFDDNEFFAHFYSPLRITKSVLFSILRGGPIVRVLGFSAFHNSKSAATPPISQTAQV